MQSCGPPGMEFETSVIMDTNDFITENIHNLVWFYKKTFAI